MIEAFHLFRDLIAIEPFPLQWSVLGMHSCHIIMKTLRVSVQDLLHCLAMECLLTKLLKSY